ncbi:MAG: hypothetical protein D6814_07800, partial [Calditrichaeota bacterium]
KGQQGLAMRKIQACPAVKLMTDVPLPEPRVWQTYEAQCHKIQLAVQLRALRPVGSCKRLNLMALSWS